MEDYRDDDAKDYWLVQFQRLLDSKPQVLIDDVSRLRYDIVFLTLFLFFRCSKKSFLSVSDEFQSL